MANAVDEYSKLVHQFSARDGAEAGQMFGKACIKVKGKAFLSQHKDWVVFKLSGEHHRHGLALEGAALWDPSGKGRPMKEWVAVPATAHKHFGILAEAAFEYVATGG